jgi:hypothetical protein
VRWHGQQIARDARFPRAHSKRFTGAGGIAPRVVPESNRRRPGYQPGAHSTELTTMVHEPAFVRFRAWNAPGQLLPETGRATGLAGMLACKSLAGTCPGSSGRQGSRTLIPVKGNRVSSAARQTVSGYLPNRVTKGRVELPMLLRARCSEHRVSASSTTWS